jgi:hypothetical protein
MVWKFFEEKIVPVFAGFWTQGNTVRSVVNLSLIEDINIIIDVRGYMKDQLKTNTFETRWQCRVWLSERHYILRIPKAVFGRKQIPVIAAYRGRSIQADGKEPILPRWRAYKCWTLNTVRECGETEGDFVRRCEMREEMEENKEGRMDKGKRNLINGRFL